MVAAADAPNYAQRLGIQKDQVVQELGWDDDVDDDIRADIEDACGGELLDEDADEVIDVVLLWWRDDDGDLVDRLMDAIRKMTLMPAQRLERQVPAMRQKGRLRVGADADITIFDAGVIIDRSTYREPSLPPVGIQHVIVNGVSVVANGQAVEGVAPGTAIRGEAPR